jgi:RNA recognition motif-containing protein
MNIYVENLPLSIKEEELRQLFSPFGTIESIFLVKDRDSGMSKGTAFVVMPSDVEADQAIAGLDGTEYDGKNLRVTRADAADFPSGEYW